MSRLMHKQILHELKVVMYPIMGIDTKVIRTYAAKFKKDPDTTIVRIGDMLDRACKLIDKAGPDIL